MANKMPPLGEPSRMGRIRRRAVWGLGGIIVVAGLAGGAFAAITMLTGGDESGDATQAQATGTPSATVSPEQALNDYVTNQLKQQYLGDCTAALMPEGQGLCSAMRGERQNRRAYLIGPSAYEYQLWVFLKNDGGVWKVESTQVVKPETVNAPGAPWPLAKGATVVVGGTGTCLNVRAAPGIKEAAVDCIADGTVIVLEEGPVEMDGYQWWRPEGRSGWVAGDWLRYADESAPGVAATPTPSG